LAFQPEPCACGRKKEKRKANEIHRELGRWLKEKERKEKGEPGTAQGEKRNLRKFSAKKKTVALKEGKKKKEGRGSPNIMMRPIPSRKKKRKPIPPSHTTKRKRRD